MKTFLNTIFKFFCKHRKFSVTIILFTLVNSCFHGGSKVNQDNLSKLFGVSFPACRASEEIGHFNDMNWSAEGKLIFKNMPSEDFYLSLDEKPHKNGYKYELYISAPSLSSEAENILGYGGYLSLTIIKGDSIAIYRYGSF